MSIIDLSIFVLIFQGELYYIDDGPYFKALDQVMDHYLRFEDGSEELYDHAADPNEWVNLAARPKYAKLLKQFRRELPTEEAPYHPSVRSGAINAWFAEHLRRHGVK